MPTVPKWVGEKRDAHELVHNATLHTNYWSSVCGFSEVNVIDSAIA